MKNQKILILDFGGQYNQLIARRVRENHVFCEVHPYSMTLQEIRDYAPIGIIFTGGPNSVYEEDAPRVDPELFSLGIPVLGICYGCQVLAQELGGQVEPAEKDTVREYGKTETVFDTSCILFEKIPRKSITWMSHGDYISKIPDGFSLSAWTEVCPAAAICCEEKSFYGVQFHPEVSHTEWGIQMLHNFLYCICRAAGDWDIGSYKEAAVEEIRNKVKDGRVLLALSGGVDSSVAAALLSEAVGEKLTCVFVDHGLMRKNEGKEIDSAFSGRKLKLVHVHAEDRFMDRLQGVSEPERKRKIIGEEFIRVFESEARKIGKVEFLAQGTIYPDVIESGAGDAAVIKSHHNVGGLPDAVDFREIIEPLRMLFKDEVRQLGRQLGLPENMVARQPFPGPGLAIRVIGELTPEKVDAVREADAIFREEIEKAELSSQPSQYFAVLTNVQTVGVMGDGRTYEYAIALRSVNTEDFMTADWTRLPYEVLDRAAVRIVNEVSSVNRVLYDVTSKPPATVEWE